MFLGCDEAIDFFDVQNLIESMLVYTNPETTVFGVYFEPRLLGSGFFTGSQAAPKSLIDNLFKTAMFSLCPIL